VIAKLKAMPTVANTAGTIRSDIQSQSVFFEKPIYVQSITGTLKGIYAITTKIMTMQIRNRHIRNNRLCLNDGDGSGIISVPFNDAHVFHKV